MTFDPALTVRLAMGGLATVALGRAAFTASRVLAYFRAARSTEGQLLLERQAELAFALARVGAVLSVLSALGSGLAVNALAPSIRGAMCGYGVVHSTSTGPVAMAFSVGSAFVGLATLELLALDGAARGLSVVRTASVAILACFAASLADVLVSARFFSELDFTVVASCCSTRVDAAGGPTDAAHARGHGAAFALLLATAALGAILSLRTGKLGARLSLAAAAVALVAASVAIPGHVAPHVFETPTHTCVYCLLGGSGGFLGLGILAGLLGGSAAALGRTIATFFGGEEPDLAGAYGRSARIRAALGLGLAVALAVAPVVRYRLVAQSSLFP